jgi:type I restriction enzyme, S subunit
MMVENKGKVNGWENTDIGNVCDVLIGGTPSRNNERYWDAEKKTNNLWVSIKDLDRMVVEETKEYISNEGVKHSNAKLVKKGTVLLSFKLTIGKVAIANKNLFTNEAIAALTPNNRINNDYLFFGLRYWDLSQNVDTAIKGSTLNKEKIKRIKVNFPKSLQEQQSIAAILITVDAAVKKTDQLIAKYQRIKAGLMQDLFCYGIDDNGKLRNEKIHKFKDSPLGKIPKEWKNEAFVNICEVRQGLQIPIIERKHEVGKNRYQYITIQYINNPDSFNDFVENPANQFICSKEDVLLTRTGNTGMVVTNVEGVFHNNFFLIDYNRRKILKLWLVYYLNRIEIQNKFMLYAGVTTIPDLKHKDFYQISSIYPKSLKEQSRITSVLSSIDTTIEQEQAYRQKLESIKRGLMEDLLSGKVRVKIKNN